MYLGRGHIAYTLVSQPISPTKFKYVVRWTDPTHHPNDTLIESHYPQYTLITNEQTETNLGRVAPTILNLSGP